MADEQDNQQSSDDQSVDQTQQTADDQSASRPGPSDEQSSEASPSDTSSSVGAGGTPGEGGADSAKIEMFENGWWSLANRTPAFAGRVGADITPFSVVVHTTDMVPDSFDGLIHRWSTELGAGDGAHFVIGRDSSTGVVQLVPITKNANHAGGNGHGQFVAGGQSWEPNLVSVGIEVHCAGGLHKINGSWFLMENGVAQGAAIADEDVVPDPQRADRGWHKVTDYQYEQLGALLDGLEDVLAALPAGCVATSIEPPPAWGVFPTGRVVGHVSLHAAQRAEPWPPTCDWIRARG